ncbi:MAG: hypothetical protein EOO65_00205 [Methanosarcinales archaeon]|nr:MAG: hypothetical protein EOO65_00205 [Methanosarcinales archaeon]
MDVIAGASEWAFDWFDANHLSSLRLFTHRHRMRRCRCGECGHLNLLSNVTSHAAKNQPHTAAVTKYRRNLRTNEQVPGAITGASSTSRARTVHCATCGGAGAK